MKRNFKLLVAVVVLVAIVMTLASCEFINGVWDKINPQPHEHTFVDGVCTECQAADPDYTPACTDHAFTVETTKAPNCTEAGEKTLTCTACGHSEKQPVAALGHTETKLDGKAPTCTETGLSEGKKCTTCGVTTVEQTTIDVTSHSFVEGECTACHAADPNYTGPKTYEWNFGLVDGGDAPKDKTVIPEGTTYVGGYFTIVGTVKYRYDSEKTPSLYCVEVDKKAQGAIEFTVTGTATVEVQFSSTGGSNTSLVGILDADGNLVPNNEGIDRVTGASAGMTVLTYNLTPGTYRVVSQDNTETAVDSNGNNLVNDKGVEANLTSQTWAEYYNRGARVFYVKVTETPLAKIDVESAASGYVDWDTKHTFTAEKAGTYTFFVPADLGMCTETKGEVDFFENDDGDTLVVYLKAGETLEYVLGAKLEATGPWTITWTVVEGDPIPDGSQDLPFKWETLPENVTVDQSNTYYTFTATATGTITFTWPENLSANYIEFCELDADGNPVGTPAEGYYKTSFKFAVEEGKTYRVQLNTNLWGVDFTDADVITIAFTACAHSWSEASCSAPATCATCGCTKGETIAHTPGAAATCTTNQECTVCHEVIDSAHHTWDYDNSVVVPANCATETNGTETTPCKYCDEKNVRDLWWEHTTVIDSHTDATCTTDGYHKEHCSVEGCTYSFEETLYASGHYSNDILDCEQEGTCAACGEKFIKQHTMGSSVVDPTCTEGGYTSHYCYWCENKNSKDTETSALGHNYVNGVCDRCEEPCTHTYTGAVCTVCGSINYGTADAPISVSDALNATANLELGAVSADPFYVEGVVTAIGFYNSTNDYYGKVYITDGTKTILVYSISKGEGITGFDKGDTIVAYGYIKNYKNNDGTGTIELASNGDVYVYAVSVVDGCKDGHTPGDAATCAKAQTCTVCDTVIADKTDVHTPGEAATCTAAQKCTVCNKELASKLDHTYDATTGLCSCGAEKPAEGETTPTVLATFTFGDNVTESPAHKDGNDIGAAKEYTSGNYKLSLTGASKVYEGNDAKGTSALKLGTGKAAATFTFTVGDDVDSVKIYVAGYKTTAGKYSINGGDTQSTTTASDEGKYECITIDTTAVKTITFTTVSGGYRLMIDAIEFVG